MRWHILRAYCCSIIHSRPCRAHLLTFVLIVFHMPIWSCEDSWSSLPHCILCSELQCQWHNCCPRSNQWHTSDSCVGWRLESSPGKKNTYRLALIKAARQKQEITVPHLSLGLPPFFHQANHINPVRVFKAGSLKLCRVQCCICESTADVFPRSMFPPPGSHEAVALTTDHKPDEAQEHQRIVENNGRVER